DNLHEVITAVEVTPGAVDEAHKMTSLIDSHTTNTLIKPDKVVPRSLISIATYTLCGIIVKTPERRQLCHLPEREAI
ncbi:MAG: hypothetical protein PHI15_08090, partial [Methanomicrobium sp.]|nr:hypothetical protein [Methanomicrobium sp.]